jgi:hypothetical protein
MLLNLEQMFGRKGNKLRKRFISLRHKVSIIDRLEEVMKKLLSKI